jgi:hypothetical protein
MEGKADAVQRDPAALLQLGHAYCAADRVPDCVAAYRRGAELDHAITADTTLRSNLLAAAGSKDEPRALPALALAVQFGFEEGRKLTTDAVVETGVPELRAGARELAEKYGFIDTVDLVSSYSLDLAELKSCEQRREVVARLRALGDKRAIGPLKSALARKGGFFANRNSNKCLRPQAEAAIRHLESL